MWVFKEHSASHDSLESSHPHITLRHTSQAGVISHGAVYTLTGSSAVFLLPLVLSGFSVFDKKPQTKEELRFSSLCCPLALYLQSDFSFNHLLFQFNFRKLFLGLKEEGESPVMLTPELRALCVCPLH